MTAAAGWRPLPTTQVAVVDEFTLMNGIVGEAGSAA
jgi:hypothetical protein